jgi:diacylglycerol kinase (ATP)
MPYRLTSEAEETRTARRVAPFRVLARESGDLVQSFNHAFEGVIAVVRTQRNMRLHFGAALIVLPLGLVLGVTRLEMVALILAVGFVILAEMFNTAVEMALDVATNSFDPRARIAKDVAAGTVLVAAVTAILVAYLVLGTHLEEPSQRAIQGVRNSPVHITVIAMAVVILLVIATKAYFVRGTPLRGGLPSGHAAVAFGGWAAITFAVQGSSNQVLISSLAFLMALLVVQTRVEAGVHTPLEVVYGGVLGAMVTAAIFQIFG